MLKILNSFLQLLFKNYIYGIFGIVSGLVVNKSSIYIMKYFKTPNKRRKLLRRIFIQTLLCALTLASFELFFFKKLALAWHTITPGYVFFTLFFAMQFELFYDLTRLFKTQEDFTNKNIM